MAKQNFVDHVIIYFTSGAGGDGVVHWRREKHVPKGGPDGGDGGDGGSIILKGNKQLWTLLDLKYRKFIKAEKGQNGSGMLCKGKDGKDITLEVPLGTVVYDAETDEELCEIIEDGDTVVLLPGGKGGLGNVHFKSSTNQTPDIATKGGEAQELKAIFELKVLADVGLVGFPNAGKSTLLSVLSAAKPEIADYPFTTLVPNLGIVKYKDFQSFAIADIPGIIEGAHEGKGLGLTFLRHIERNAVLLFMIPANSENPVKELNILKNELKEYNPELADKDFLVAITKIDLLGNDELKKLKRKFKDALFISSATQIGLEELKDKLFEKIKSRERTQESFD